MIPKRVLAELGGFASRDELLARRCDADHIDLSLRYRWILPVRKGFYASKDLDPLLLRALRVGGRLACVSALDWYAGVDVAREAAVHVVVPRNASRLRDENAVVHWTRRALAGSRTVVSPEVARRQAERCRALRGARGPGAEGR